jgi:hypothetical protein
METDDMAPQQTNAISISSELDIKVTSKSNASYARVSKLTVTRTPYGVSIYEGRHSEWQLDIRATSRQDGNTAWTVVLTEVDGDSQTLSGMSAWTAAPYAIIKAIQSLTNSWATHEFVGA